ncbi:hypothetical protein R3P38DRAFT_3120011 [Favolaschia claudopus]|uniref:Uncharacterized protein n=1 Tax=Favolaschia claudopus TaxID=2862362 RepID=A0AAV9ZE23_9AGAR
MSSHLTIRKATQSLRNTRIPPPSSISTSRATNSTLSLPPPLLFDGPSGRRPVLMSALESHLAPYTPRSGRERGEASRPVITLFDGPAYSGGRATT